MYLYIVSSEHGYVWWDYASRTSSRFRRLGRACAIQQFVKQITWKCQKKSPISKHVGFVEPPRAAYCIVTQGVLVVVACRCWRAPPPPASPSGARATSSASRASRGAASTPPPPSAPSTASASWCWTTGRRPPCPAWSASSPSRAPARMAATTATPPATRYESACVGAAAESTHAGSGSKQWASTPHRRPLIKLAAGCLCIQDFVMPVLFQPCHLSQICSRRAFRCFEGVDRMQHAAWCCNSHNTVTQPICTLLAVDRPRSDSCC
jgi:hypothetical protein